MDIAQVFDQIANTMRADFQLARSAVKHEGIRGAALEATFRRFLRDYLPNSLDVSTGMLIDSYGGTTRQLDVVISDAARTPVLYRSDYARVIPIECAFAVFEVKSFLSLRALRDVFQNMRSVYALRTAPALLQRRIERIRDEHGNFMSQHSTETMPKYMLKGVESEYYPVNYFVFAYDSILLPTLSRHLVDEIREQRLPPHQRVDMICVLEKGLISNRTHEHTFWALPEPGSGIVDSAVSRPLLAFYGLLSQVLFQAHTPLFDFGRYLVNVDFNPR